MGVYLQVGLAN